MKQLKTITTTLAIFFLIIMPVFVFAQPADPNAPLIKDKAGIEKVLSNFVVWMANIFWILTVGSMIWTAYKFLSAGEDADQIKTAKSMLKYTLIAAAVALLATSVGTITSDILSGGSGGTSQGGGK